jgi:hypothetical protein
MNYNVHLFTCMNETIHSLLPRKTIICRKIPLLLEIWLNIDKLKNIGNLDESIA